MSIEGVKEQKSIEPPESQKFDSVESFRVHFERLCEEEKEEGGVSHFTFGESFQPKELTEEDLEIWNLTQDYLDDGIIYGEFMEKFRAYQLGLANKDLNFSSRGKFSSFLTNLIMAKDFENLRRQKEAENN